MDKKSLKKFGITMGSACLVIALIIFIKAKHSIVPAAALSALFFILGYGLPGTLKPLYIFWMRLALVLSWINTRIILTVVFYLLITPMAVIYKIFGADLLDKRIDKTKRSYWIPKEKSAGLNYEKQF